MGDIGNVGRLRMGGNDTETSQALGHLREIARKASISRSNSPATAFIVLPSAELLKSLVKPLANTVVSLWNYGKRPLLLIRGIDHTDISYRVRHSPQARGTLLASRRARMACRRLEG